MSTNVFDDPERNPGAGPDPVKVQPPELGPDPMPATLEAAHAHIRMLEAELSSRSEEAALLSDRLLRERAEVENFKKRMVRERADATRYAATPVLHDVLPALDNLQRAIDAAEESACANPAIRSMQEGVAMVLQQLVASLGQHGLRQIESVGRPFDPGQHEALGELESTTLAAGNILVEHTPGYRLHERLLRPARVSVSIGPGPAVGN